MPPLLLLSNDIVALLSMIASVVSALATVGALGAAIYAGLWAARVAKIEFRRDHQADEDARRAQAVEVSAWVTWQNIGIGGYQYGAFLEMVVLSNGSSQPIYEFWLRVHVKVGQTWSESVAKSGPIVPPREQMKQNIERFGVPMQGPSEALVEMWFRDAANAWWHRDQHGVLTGIAGLPAELARPEKVLEES